MPDEINNRLLFPNMRLFKSEMTRSFTFVTQSIFKNHPAYRFDEDDSKTQIMIHPTFSDVSNPGKMAKIMFRAGGYDASLNDYWDENFARIELDEKGNEIGKQSSKMITSTMTVLVQAYNEMESQDLADELLQLIIFGAKGFYAQHHVHIIGGQVGETSPLKDQEGSFQTMISISYKAYLILTKRYATIETGDIEIDPEYDKHAGDRFPGVFVFPETNRPKRE